MEGEAGEVEVIASITHTCAWEEAASSRRCGLGAGEHHCGGHLEAS